MQHSINEQQQAKRIFDETEIYYLKITHTQLTLKNRIYDESKSWNDTRLHSSQFTQKQSPGVALWKRCS